MFQAALSSLGYRVQFTTLHKTIGPDDVLVIWNRYALGENQARLFERAGAAVIVAENGYLPMRGTKKAFSLALNHHNGAGAWVGSEEPRAGLLDVELQPWTEVGRAGDVVILPQRGIGPPGVAMPRSWPQEMQRRLVATGRRNIRIRPHPGTEHEVLPLAEDLVGAACCVTWGSGAGLKAMIAGVPVFYEFVNWIGKDAARFGIERLDDPHHGDREALLERVACAQWTVEEVATGAPLAGLVELSRTRGKKHEARKA